MCPATDYGPMGLLCCCWHAASLLLLTLTPTPTLTLTLAVSVVLLPSLLSSSSSLVQVLHALPPTSKWAKLRCLPKFFAKADYEEHTDDLLRARRKIMMMEMDDESESEDEGNGEEMLSRFKLVNKGKRGWYRKVFKTVDDGGTNVLTMQQAVLALTLALGHSKKHFEEHVREVSTTPAYRLARTPSLVIAPRFPT